MFKEHFMPKVLVMTSREDHYCGVMNISLGSRGFKFNIVLGYVHRALRNIQSLVHYSGIVYRNRVG